MLLDLSLQRNFGSKRVKGTESNEENVVMPSIHVGQVPALQLRQRRLKDENNT